MTDRKKCLLPGQARDAALPAPSRTHISTDPQEREELLMAGLTSWHSLDAARKCDVSLRAFGGPLLARHAWPNSIKARRLLAGNVRPQRTIPPGICISQNWVLKAASAPPRLGRVIRLLWGRGLARAG